MATDREPILEPGNPRSLARAIRLLDDEPQAGRSLLQSVYERTGRAWIIGITGPSGVGKSTLISQMIHRFRQRDQTVGVVAIDPTSPFSGGAILGDRIRMHDHEGDPGVFIRSLATRGQMGGLSRSTYDIVDLMDAYGMDVILVETVGVGQDEVDIARVAHTVLLVLVPGLGDEIQALKAGLMEIADIYVINKRDRDGAERMKREIEAILALSDRPREFPPPVLMTEAHRGGGIDELMSTLDRHFRYLHESSALQRRRHTYARLRFVEAVRTLLTTPFEDQALERSMEPYIEAIENALQDPYGAARKYLKEQIDRVVRSLADDR